MKENQYTILSKKKDFQSVLNYVEKNFDLSSFQVDKENSKWSSIFLKDRINGLEIKLVSKVRKRPMDDFSKLILGLFNYINKTDAEDEFLKKKLLKFISEVNLVIGVTVSFSKDVNLNHIYKLTEILEGMIFNGSEIINSRGERALETKKEL